MAEADIVSQYLRAKFSSLLEEAESDPDTPSRILSRFQSVERTINSMSESTASSPPIPRDLLYKIIDAVSEIRIFAHHHRKAASSKKGFFWALTVTPLSQYRSLKKIKNQLDKIEKDLKNPPESDILPLPKIEIQETYPALDASSIIGFESQSEQIEGWLIDNLSDTEGLTAIGITGRCGCGKTALAQKVFSSPRIQNEFSPRVWVCLSNMLFEHEGIDTRVKILTCILEEISVLECSDFSLNELLERLQAVLTEKRYLIVLDDVWRVHEWYADLDHSLPTGSSTAGELFTHGLPKGSGGGVIVTSRRESVIKRTVGEKRVIRLQPEKYVIWKIFCDIISKRKWDSDQKLEEIKEDVIRTCDGLPLAATTLGHIISQSLWIPARALNISWGDDTRYWKWISDTRSGEEWAELLDVCWINVNVTVELKKLLMETSYSAYMVFKLTKEAYGLTDVEVHVRFVSGRRKGDGENGHVFIKGERIPSKQGHFPQARGREWMEVKLGEFFNDVGDGEIEVGLSNSSHPNSDDWKSGLIVRGIEIRPNYY